MAVYVGVDPGADPDIMMAYQWIKDAGNEQMRVVFEQVFMHGTQQVYNRSPHVVYERDYEWEKYKASIPETDYVEVQS